MDQIKLNHYNFSCKTKIDEWKTGPSLHGPLFH